MNSYIRTHTGERVDLRSPNASMIHLEDIAHALAHICRFTGHTTHHYSVAEHSILCARIALVRGCSQRAAAACLMHDAAEAYVGDVSSPLKRLISAQYAPIEKRFERCIAERFQIFPAAEIVKAADQQALRIEQYDLLQPEFDHVETSPFHAIGWSAPTAKKMFLQRCAELEIA